MTFFWCKFDFGKCFGAISWSSCWAGLCWLSYKIHFMLHITVQLRNESLLLDRIREDDTSKWQFFWFSVSSWGTHLSSSFTFPICFKCWRTVEWLTLSFGATSCVVGRGSVSGARSSLLSASCGWPPCSSSSRLVSCAQLLEPPLHWTFVSSSWAKCVCWCCELSLASWPILNLNKKIAQICFWVSHHLHSLKYI